MLGYTIRGRGGRVKYVGITNNPRRRAAQHRRSGKRGQLRVETGGMSATALALSAAWVVQHLAFAKGRHPSRDRFYG